MQVLSLLPLLLFEAGLGIRGLRVIVFRWNDGS